MFKNCRFIGKNVVVMPDGEEIELGPDQSDEMKTAILDLVFLPYREDGPGVQ